MRFAIELSRNRAPKTRGRGFGGFLGGLFGGYVSKAFGKQASAHYTPYEAMQLPAIRNAVSLFQSEMSAMPIVVERVMDDGTPVPLGRSVPDVRVACERWGHESSGTARRKMMKSLMLWGFAAVYVVRTEGRLEALQVLDPRYFTRTKDLMGRAVFKWSGGGGIPRRIPRDDLAFVEFDPSLDNWRQPVPPLAQCWPAVRAGLQATNFASTYFDTGRPGAMGLQPKEDFVAGEDVDDEAQEKMWKAFDKMRKEGRGDFIVPDGYELTAAPPDAISMQITQMRTFAVQEIARVFQIPPIALQDMSKSTLANFDASVRALIRHSIRGWAKTIGEELSYAIWPSGRRRLRLDRRAVMREPDLPRAQAYKLFIEGRVYKPNEIRRLEGLPPADEPWADKLIPLGTPILPATNTQPGENALPVETESSNDEERTSRLDRLEEARKLLPGHFNENGDGS